MKKLMKGAVLGTLASVLLLSGCSNEQAAPANEEKRVCTVTIHSQPKPVKWKTKEIVFCLKANQRLSSWYDLSGCLMSYFL